MSIVAEIMEDITDVVAGVRHHRVEFGENGATISRYYYGTPHHLVDIFQANRSIMMDVNDVKPGMVLLIPHITNRRYCRG